MARAYNNAAGRNRAIINRRAMAIRRRVGLGEKPETSRELARLMDAQYGTGLEMRHHGKKAN